MKAINYITCLFALGACLFAFLLWQKSNRSYKVLESLQELIKSQQEKNAKKTLAPPTEEIDAASAEKIHQYFKDNVKSSQLNYPNSIYVDATFVNFIRNNLAYDGFQLVFGAYNETGISNGGMHYQKDSVAIILAPTIDTVMQRGIYYDYGDPCKPPCTINFQR